MAINLTACFLAVWSWTNHSPGASVPSPLKRRLWTLTHRVRMKLKFKTAVTLSVHNAFFIHKRQLVESDESKLFSEFFFNLWDYRFSNSWMGFICLHLDGKALERLDLVLLICFYPLLISRISSMQEWFKTVFSFLWLHLWHIEVPKPGIKHTATATWATAVGFLTNCTVVSTPKNLFDKNQRAVEISSK